MSARPLVPVDGNNADWPRQVANAVNRLNINFYPFPSLAVAPTAPGEGQTYYDTALHNVRTWNGSAWMNHF